MYQARARHKIFQGRPKDKTKQTSAKSHSLLSMVVLGGALDTHSAPPCVKVNTYFEKYLFPEKSLFFRKF